VYKYIFLQVFPVLFPSRSESSSLLIFKKRLGSFLVLLLLINLPAQSSAPAALRKDFLMCGATNLPTHQKILGYNKCIKLVV
jgi:hypothetical protein